jgi:hypothetical protein
MAALRQALDADASLWEHCGDLAATAEEAWLALLTGQDLMARESVRRKLDAMRAELGGPGPSPLEKLLVGRVVACWLQVHYADALYAQARGPQTTMVALQEMTRRQESSQRRYLAAIKQLALVRKLIRPAPSPLDVAAKALREGPPEKTASRAGRTASRSEPVTAGVPVLN